MNIQPSGRKSLLIVISYIVISLSLFFYSYTQVDLGLTLAKANVFQLVQKTFQYIGFFNRPLSTGIYLGILIALFSAYGIALVMIKKRVLGARTFWKLLGVLVVILVFSYPAFSYDMFNYMFTAKTILVYHKNPYGVTPLQFTGIEPWLSFMHWTHLSSAYTPLWIVFTLPAYFLGFGYFLLILWNIKILVASFYLVAVWLIGKILDIVDKEHALFGMAIFALNPLIIIESLVSGHNDVLMMTFALASIYLYLKKQRVWSFFSLATSIGLKLLTVFLVPVFFLKWNRAYALLAMLLGFFLVIVRREVLPWYWVWIMPMVAINPTSTKTIILANGFSLALLLRYAPFLYFGHWNEPVGAIQMWLLFASLIFSLLVMFRYRR